jgi:long-chain acyl-CoA synthetase
MSDRRDAPSTDLDAIEAHYRQSALVRDVCVIGEARGARDERGLRAVVVADAAEIRRRRIVNRRDWLRFEIETISARLPTAQRIVRIDVSTADLPRAPDGTLQRDLIRRQCDGAEGGALARVRASTSTPWPSDSPSAAMVAAAVAHLAPHAPCGPETSLDLDLGLDSIARVELIARLEDAFDAPLDAEETQEIYTLGDLAHALAAARSRRANRTGCRGPSTAGHRDERDGEPGAGTVAGPAAPPRDWPRDEAGRDPWPRLLETATPGIGPAVTELARPKWALAIVMFALLKVVHGLAYVCLGLRVHGRHHLPRYGPSLLCPNHQSFLDGLVLAAVLPFGTLRAICLAGATEYFDSPLTTRLARLWNIVAVDPDANLLAGMRVAAAALRLGRVLVIFPEGERSIDERVTTFRKGAAILASRLQVPTVPVSIDGLHEVWPRGRGLQWQALLPRRGRRVRIAVGEPMSSEALAAGLGTDEEIAERLRQVVTELKRAHPARRPFG